LLKIPKQLGNLALYFDTDSVIYISRPGDWEPERGNVLGEWDSQLKPGESHITSFMSLGPKTYTYVTDKGRVEMKINSITQNGFTEDIREWNEERGEHVRTGKALNKAALESLLRNEDEVVRVVYPSFLKRDKKSQAIQSVVMPKTLRLVYDKRILLEDFTTIPFGTKEPGNNTLKIIIIVYVVTLDFQQHLRRSYPPPCETFLLSMVSPNSVLHPQNVSSGFYLFAIFHNFFHFRP